MSILELAMPVPLRRSFDYLPPRGSDPAQIDKLQPGCRVRAPFGRRQLVGILLSVKTHSDINPLQLKPATEILDSTPPIGGDILKLARWAAHYYQHPIGEALASTLPVLLRKGETLPSLAEVRWRLSAEGKGLPQGALQRARQQARLLALLQQHTSLNRAQLRQESITTATVRALLGKGLVEAFEEEPELPRTTPAESALTLNEEQQAAVEAVVGSEGFQCFLLDGVTGSGKTEVYLQLIAQAVHAGRQALVLIPEIGLTPQTLSRFQRRFECPVVALHSGMSDRERLLGWQKSRQGRAGIIIGTRSAVFTPLAHIGIIIVDEEHDSSFKQQDGFRYSARDVAIKRAANAAVPIILGSATPSLESLNNAQQGRYRHLCLRDRATGAKAPQIELLDIRHAPMDEGFSPQLIDAIQTVLTAGNQALIFINRRGFSPVLLCHDCGFIAHCHHCDARLTVHYQQRRLRCHHCDYQQELPRSCPECRSHHLDFQGIGTERSQNALQRLFPGTPILRIDRDTTGQKEAMQSMLETIRRGDPAILVGTQMLAKGHHFADVTLVAVLDADQGLFSADFRAAEKMGQLLIQVAGRAGREDKPGRVIVQTHQPDHPLLTNLVQHDYQRFAGQLLTERRERRLPPFSHLALLRAEAGSPEAPEQFLRSLRDAVPDNDSVQRLGPLPAPMTRRAGRYRFHLILQAERRSTLHREIDQLCDAADRHPLSKKVRWHLDIDPIDPF